MRYVVFCLLLLCSVQATVPADSMGEASPHPHRSPHATSNHQSHVPQQWRAGFHVVIPPKELLFSLSLFLSFSQGPNPPIQLEPIELTGPLPLRLRSRQRLRRVAFQPLLDASVVCYRGCESKSLSLANPPQHSDREVA